MVNRLNEIQLFRNLIACFWFLWLGILSLSNGVDCLQIFGLVHHDFPFSANNYDLLVDFTATYGFSDLLNQILFMSFTLMLFALTAYVGKGVFDLLKHDNGKVLHKGFLCGLTVSAGCILADQIFINYDTEQNHLILLIAQLISFFIILKLNEMKLDLLSGRNVHSF